MDPKLRMGAVLTAVILFLVIWFLQHEQNEDFEEWKKNQSVDTIKPE
jgi:hypothetical protein